MSGKCRPRRKASSYRDALYATLEAAVREDTKNTTASIDSSSSSGIINNNNNNSNDDEEHVSCTTACVDYPSPFLWYEEMTPADIDAYHARHVNNVDRVGSSIRCCGSSSNHLESSSATRTTSRRLADEAVSPSNDDAYRELHLRAHGVLRNAVAAEELAEAERETTRMQTSEQQASSSARPSSPSLSSAAAAASNLRPSHNRSSPQRGAGIVKTRRMSQQEEGEDNEPMTMEQQRPYGESVDDDSADDVRSRRFLTTGTLSSCRVESVTNTTALTAVRKAAAAASSCAPSSSPVRQTPSSTLEEPAASSNDRPPVNTTKYNSQAVVASDASVQTSTANVEQQQHETMAAPIMRLASSSQNPPASRYRPITPTPNDGGSRKDTDSEDEEKEEEGRAATASSTHHHHHDVDRRRSKQEAWLTTTPPPPPCSQLTQQSMLFQPGLPSQVLVTQQQQGGLEWDHDQHAVEMEEEETHMSEYGLSFPASHYCSYRDPPPPGVSVPEARGGCVLSGDKGTSQGWDKNAQEGVGDGMIVDSEGGGGGSRIGASNPARQQQQQEEEGHTRQHEEFTRALGALFGNEEACAGGTTSKKAAVEGGVAQRSGDARSEHQSRQQQQQQFIFVPTEEVLPRGYRLGQAGVCALLEDRLSRARELAPKGYAARALELACHVLRQSKVCVRRPEQEHASSSIDRMLRNMDSTETLADGHAEVVGVAGFVWEILRTSCC